MSPDGQILAIGSLHHDNDIGQVKVYAWNGSDYIQRGSDIDGSRVGGRAGRVSLSSDGSTVAIGAINYDDSGRNDTGQVRVFTWNGSAWVQRGNSIYGQTSWMLGRDTSLNSDGTILAVSSESAYNQTGFVKIYNWNGSSWIQYGDGIFGSQSGDWCGVSNSMSDDGSVLAMGCPSSDFVRVHE